MKIVKRITQIFKNNENEIILNYLPSPEYNVVLEKEIDPNTIDFNTGKIKINTIEDYIRISYWTELNK